MATARTSDLQAYPYDGQGRVGETPGSNSDVAVVKSATSAPNSIDGGTLFFIANDAAMAMSCGSATRTRAAR